MTDVVGQSLGQYRVIELIGQGGMARVYKGYQTSLARNVAIKAIPTQIDNTRDNEFAQRFITEARLIARLTHPNIVPVHDYGEDKGWAFIVMEYISGGTLRNRIAAAEAHRGRLDLLPLSIYWRRPHWRSTLPTATELFTVMSSQPICCCVPRIISCCRTSA